jgi:hypothetical protein
VAEPQPPLSVGDGRNGFSSVSLYIVPSGGSHSFVQVKKKSKRAGKVNTVPTERFHLVIHVLYSRNRSDIVGKENDLFRWMDKFTLATVMDGNL